LCLGFVQDRGLACFSYSAGSWADSESWTFYPIPHALSWEEGRALALAPDGALWLLAANGVARLDPSTPVGERASGPEWKIYVTQERLASSRKAIAFGPDGEIWFGARRFQPEQAQALQPTEMPE
jgi:streptogramin lyase